MARGHFLLNQTFVKLVVVIVSSWGGGRTLGSESRGSSWLSKNSTTELHRQLFPFSWLRAHTAHWLKACSLFTLCLAMMKLFVPLSYFTHSFPP